MTDSKLRGVLLFARDAGIALAFVAGILLAMYAYTGLWPPLVVVESNSMMHSDENVSYIGVIDTGDLVLVKDVGSTSDIRTYVDGFVSGHRTYGDYGDVIIYKVNGNEGMTPIIHRAIIYLQANEDGRSYRAESLQNLPDGKWATTAASDSWDELTSVLMIYDVGYNDRTVAIDVRRIIDSFRGSPVTSGYITKGDHNQNIDQSSTGRYTPVDIGWVVGKARGEIPWFGLLKLWATDSLGSTAPPNSVRNLWMSLAAIVIVPIVIDVLVTYRIRKRIARRREAAAREHEAEQSAQRPPDPARPTVTETAASSDMGEVEEK